MTRHVPVLLQETIDGLMLRPGMKVIDGTVGDAGHSEAILKHIGPKGQLLAIDVDPESLLRAKQFLYTYADQVICERSNFDDMETVAHTHGFGAVDAILLDLGWSTPQFAERGRGFRFSGQEPLDMRYDQTTPVTAIDLLADSSEHELTRMFQEYADERFAKDIAREIVHTRKQKPLACTTDLVEIVLDVYRKRLRSKQDVPWIGGNHPATGVFQALRIAVNDELGVIKRVLPQAVELLVPGGRLAVISFHSIEDSIVKHYFKSEHQKTGIIITKKPIVCGEEEYQANSPSRSAKLRIFQKI